MTDKPDSAPKKPGPKLLGKYALLRELGRGGMGVVYEAEDTQLHRQVALKLLISRQGADPAQAEQERQRFDREAQAIAKLKHPNIVMLYEAGEIQSRRFLAMELIDGQPFSAWWKQKTVKLPQKVTVLRDVALGVDHAHEQGILHRDLKPANILVDAKNKPYVMDFGLAKAADPEVGLSLTSEGLVVGTPAYMSPEQARGLKTVDGRTDVYSMGVMLYEMLAGRQPFEGETAIDILMKASKERVTPPSSASMIAPDPAMDRVIENICLKALARSPADRYASAKAFALDLGRWLKGEAVAIKMPATQRRIGVVRKSRGWPVAVGGAAAAAVAIGAAFLFFSSTPTVGAELSRARDFLKAKKYTEARIEFGKALAMDPGNLEAIAGDREAKAAEEKSRQEEARKEKQRQELQDAQTKSDHEAKEAGRIKLEAEAKAKAAAAAASDAEQKRLLDELATIREKARQAEEDARLAKAQLDKLTSERSSTPAPETPKPGTPAPAPAPVAKPAPAPLSARDREAKLAQLRVKRDAAIEAVNISAAFAAIDLMAQLSTDVNPIAEKSEALKTAKKHLKAREDAGALAAGHLRLGEEALTADDFKVSAQAAKDAQNIGKQAGEVLVAEQAIALQKEITAVKALYDRFVKAQQTLTVSPQDAAANAEAGRWLCLVKERWDEGLPMLARGSDDPMKKLAEQDAAAPATPEAQAALADAWAAAGQKERNDTTKSRCFARALYWYDGALPGLRGTEKFRVEKRIDDCYKQARLETRIVFVPEESMKVFPVGQRYGSFPEQKTDDPLAVFRGEGIYFNQKTGTDAVYQVRSGRRLRHLSWRGAAMQDMTIEILDPNGTVLAKGGPWAGGNAYADFTLDFPPVSRFTLRLRNHISTWYFVESVKLE